MPNKRTFDDIHHLCMEGIREKTTKYRATVNTDPAAAHMCTLDINVFHAILAFVDASEGLAIAHSEALEGGGAQREKDV